ncbi:MAG: HNH endonuclease signature motif containing protein, partial [Actinomycetes bacterium]
SAETSNASEAGEPVPDGTSVQQRSWTQAPPSATAGSGHRLSPSTVMRLLCHSPTQLIVRARDGRPLDLGRSQRHANRRQRRALRVRDGCCRFPGCTQRHRLIPHHVVWWTRGGPTDLDLLVLVCPTHHRAVHDIGYDVTALGEGRFAWYRPTGERIDDAPRLAADAAELTTASITADTIAPTWGGERLDLGHLVGGLADNLLNGAGHNLADLPDNAVGAALRQAAGWPELAVPPPWQVVPAA